MSFVKLANRAKKALLEIGLPILISSPMVAAFVIATQGYLESLVLGAPGFVVWLVALLAMALIAVSLRLWAIMTPKHDNGTYISRDRKMRYCVRCFHDKKERVPLKTEEHGWRCPLCMIHFPDPSRPKPEGKSKRAVIASAPPSNTGWMG